MKRGVGILFILLLLVSACARQEATSGRTLGTVYFLLKDKLANIEDVTSFEVTISNVLVHSSDNDNWVSVTTQSKTFDLVSLSNNEILGLIDEKRLEVGNYNQIRFEVNEVKAVLNGEKITAKIPSNTIKIIGDIEVLSGNGNVVLLDFLLNESLHMTGEGKLIFVPVIKFESYTGASVQLQQDKANIKGGNKKFEVEVSMDENGVVAQGNKIKEDVELTIDSYGIIKKFDSNMQKEVSHGTGALILSVSDENLFDLTNVTALNVVLSSVEIHKIGTPDESWISINSTPKEFNLLELNSSSAIFASTEIQDALYNQIRFKIINASLVRGNLSTSLVVPSSSLKFVGNYRVEQNKTTQVDFDFDPFRSLVSSGDKIHLKPTIKVVVLLELDYELQADGKIKVKSSKKVEEKEFLFE